MNLEMLLLLFFLCAGLVLARKQRPSDPRQPVRKALKIGVLLSVAYLLMDTVFLKGHAHGFRELGFALIWIGVAVWFTLFLHHHHVNKDDEDWEAC